MFKVNWASPVTWTVLGVGAVALYVFTRGAEQTGKDIGSGAVDLVGGVVAGAVESTGAVFGIPNTDHDQCEKCKAEGNKLCASQYCTAREFLSWIFGGTDRSKYPLIK